MKPYSDRIIWIVATLVFLHTPRLCAAGNELRSLFGRWQVTAVRLDGTLMRTPTYNINDPELMGRWILIAGDRITTNMPEETTCQIPHVKVETSTVIELVNRTMGKSVLTSHEINKFKLPVSLHQKSRIFWITCREGDIGPDIPFGPVGANWIAELSPQLLAMRWYDNTILLLKRR